MFLRWSLPLLIAASLFTLCMPDEWHYERLGEVREISIDTVYGKNNDGSTFVNYYAYDIVYETPDGEFMKNHIDAATKNNGVNDFMGRHTVELMDRHMDKYAYRYKWWTFCMVYIGTLIFFLIFSVVFISTEDHNCHTCPLYAVCNDKDKERGLMIPKWMRRRPKLKIDMKI